MIASDMTSTITSIFSRVDMRFVDWGMGRSSAMLILPGKRAVAVNEFTSRGIRRTAHLVVTRFGANKLISAGCYREAHITDKRFVLVEFVSPDFATKCKRCIFDVGDRPLPGQVQADA